MLQPIDIHQLVQAIPQHLVHQGMIRYFTFALDIFKTGQLVRKHQRHQVFSIVALEWGGYALAATHPWYRQRNIGDPAPARWKHRRIQQGLDQNMFNRVRG